MLNIIIIIIIIIRMYKNNRNLAPNLRYHTREI